MFVSGRVPRDGSRHSAEIGSDSGVFKPALLALALATAFTGAHGQTNPAGGVAVHGQAVFNAPAANQLNVVTQNGAGTSHSAINWQSFSIAPGNSTNFQQPSTTSTVINRVVTNTPSSIFGTLSSNGRLVLVNQSGIAVGAGAVIDTAGFAASALRMTDADALAGRLRFGDALGSSSILSVDGRITARNGDVVLTAPNIAVGVSALIQSPNGSTVLAAGQQVEITGRGLEGILLRVQAPSDTVRNLGNLRADAVGIFAGTLHHSGEIQATTASLEGGSVVLKASGDTYVEGTGKISATGRTGGHVDVLGNRVAVLGTALIDVSGANGGGAIRIGGDYQGKNPSVPNAQMTYVGPGTVLKADATDRGDGGKVIVWSDDVTRAHGSISANAGPAGGGGFVETSGHHYLDVAGIRVAASGSAKRPGTWLLDPSNVKITHGAATLVDVISQTITFGPGTETIFAPVNGPITTSSLTDGDINAALNTNSNIQVLISTTNPSISGGQSGDITFDGSSGAILIDRSNSGNLNSSILRLDADHDIVFKAGSSTTFRKSGTAGATLTVELNPANQIRSEGITGPNAAAIVVLDGAVDEVSLNIKNGRVWDNFGSVTLNNLSVIRLPNEAGYATFSNHAPDATNPLGGVLNVNSTSPWSFLSDSGLQGGIVNNAGTVTVNGANGGNTTSWEALYSNLSGGKLNIAATKLLSMQNMGTIDGSVFVDAGGELRLPEQHTGGRNFSNTAFSGAGKITVNPSIVANFSNTSGTIGILGVGGTINDLSGILSVQSYLQITPGSAFTGAGGLSVSSGFNHTAGTFNPTGAISINQASGDLIFGDALNAASIALSSSSGSLFVNGALTASGPVSLLASTGITVNASITANAPLNAGTFNATTVGLSPIMRVNRGIISSGAMNLNLTGGLVLQSGSGQDAFLQTAGSQTITAKYVEVNAAGSDFAYIATTGGNQSITTSGKNASNEGLVIQNTGNGLASVNSGSGLQTVTVNDADIVRITGTGGDATLNSSGTQTIVIRGTGQNSFRVGSAAATGVSSVNGINQVVTAGQSGQLGNIQVRGGVTDGKVSNIYNASGTQTISTTGTLTVVGGTASGLSGSPSACSNVGACAIVDNQSASGQTITAGGLVVQGGSSGGYNIGAIQALISGATQAITVTGGGTIALTGGSGSNGNNQASIYTQGSAQNIDFSAGGALQVTGGTVGPSNFAQVIQLAAGSNQALSGASSITLTGGANGGGFGTGNFARLQSAGSQAVSVGAGGITMAGGGGSLTDNAAQIHQDSIAGTQSITVGGGGAITLLGGTSTATTVGTTHGSRAMIQARGTSQQIQFSSGGSVVMTGGSAGQRNFADIEADSGTQSITGSPTIVMTGGSAGGIPGEGNGAYINATAGSQNITASSIALTGGTGGSDNLAQIRQGNASQGLSSTQTLTITGGGNAALRGGAGATNLARIQSFGSSQALAFNGGNLLLQGGTGASNNFARIHALNGTQSITGSPNITVLGGATGGADTAGNFADIFSSVSAQTIVGRNISLIAGTSGIENFAGIRAPVQNITVHGNLSMTGGGSAPSSDGTSGGGARIGGVSNTSPTSLQLAVDGDLTLTGGMVAKAGSAIGANVVGAQPTNITITAGGNVTLNPGSGVGAGSRIGSPATNTAGGDISITAGGTIALNGATAGDTAIRTLGNISLDANLLAVNNLVSGASIRASGLSGVNLGGAGQLMALAPSGDTIKVVTGTGNFTNQAGPTALSVASGGRWLIFSNDPARDTLGGLASDFNQFNTSFSSAGAVQKSGNGLVYRVAAPASKTTVEVEAEAQTQVQVAFLNLLQKTLDAQVERPLDRDKRERKDAIAIEGEVCR